MHAPWRQVVSRSGGAVYQPEWRDERPLDVARPGRVGIGSVGMDAKQPGLFDLPDLDQPGSSERSQRGRNRETWTLTATAAVTIVDAGALREAFARAEEGGVTIDLRDDPGTCEPQGSDGPRANDAFDALAWQIWPTDGLDELLEAGAFRILSVESEAVAESIDEGKAIWTVTVKLTDVDQLRHLAVRANPGEAGLIADSLAVAWQSAADPFAPLQSIPGIHWRPGQVVAENLAARAHKSR